MATPVPITAKIHYDDIQKEYRVVASREDPKGGAPFDVNEVIKLVDDALTLLEIVAIIIQFFSGTGPTGGAAPENEAIGDYAKFASYTASLAGGTYSPTTP